MSQPSGTKGVQVTSGGLLLEGVLHLPPGSGPYPAVAVCHPHPLYGGDMDNAVVTAVCAALVEQGVASLRFNFRGTGQSQGTHAGGTGEVDDAVAALDHLCELGDVNATHLALAGYSFGAGVALNAALRTPLARAVVAIACPLATLKDAQLLGLEKPKLFLAGDRDQFLPVHELHRAVERLPGPTEVHVLPGADHFFWGHERVVAGHVAQFMAAMLR